MIDRSENCPCLRAGFRHCRHREGLRLEFVCWFVGVVFLSGREDEPNHPRHQPTEAPTTSSTTRTPTTASFKARRKTRRATNRKSATATKAITPVVMAIVISLTFRKYSGPRGTDVLFCPAYCFLPSAFLYSALTVVLMFPRTLKSPSISTLIGSQAFTKSSRIMLITCS